MKSMAQGIKQRTTYLIRLLGKWVGGFVVLLILLFCSIGWMVNHMSSSGEINRFVAENEVVRTTVGSVKADDVVIHSLTEFSTNGELSVNAVAVAAGSKGQARVALSGVRSASDERLRLVLRGVQPVRCHLIFVCSDLDPQLSQ